MLNQLKTVLLLGVLSALVIALGGLLGPSYFLLAIALAVLMNAGAYFVSDRIVLRMHGARQIDPGSAPRLSSMVQELADRAGIPVPRLFLIPSAEPNAFATGRSPAKGVVAVTEGLLDQLDDREVRGVIAHEIAHIKNRDILIASVAAMLAAGVSGIANIFQFAFLFGGASQDDDGGSPWAALAAVIVAPIAATLLQLGVSRSREFVADATAAELTGDAEGLAGALERMERIATAGAARGLEPAAATPATASLFIIHPLSGRRGLARLFSTHPETRERVRRLRALAPTGRLAMRAA